MRVVGLERRLMTVGKIRCGDLVATGKGRARPQMLEKLRLTSSNAFLLAEAEKLYGGKTRVWETAPAGTKQYELYVEVDAIPIIIPPMESLSQCYEVWSAKGCLRRCDGATIGYALETNEVGQPCRCPVDPEERLALAANGQACKLTTRISCMLPDLPGLALWGIETHSYYASLWTAGMVEFLEGLAKQGRICEALLKIERQTRKGKQGVRHFAIPTILPQQMTPRQLFTQEMHRALHPGEPRKALPDESQKSLPQHISDLYNTEGIDLQTGEINPDPLVARIDEILTAQGLDAVARAAWWTRMDAKYAGRSPMTLTMLYEQLQAAASKKRQDSPETHQDAPGSTVPPGDDLGVPEGPAPSWGPGSPNLFAEEETEEEHTR